MPASGVYSNAVNPEKAIAPDEIGEENALLSTSTRFILNTDESTVEESEYLLTEAEKESPIHA